MLPLFFLMSITENLGLTYNHNQNFELALYLPYLLIDSYDSLSDVQCTQEEQFRADMNLMGHERKNVMKAVLAVFKSRLLNLDMKYTFGVWVVQVFI